MNALGGMMGGMGGVGGNNAALNASIQQQSVLDQAQAQTINLQTQAAVQKEKLNQFKIMQDLKTAERKTFQEIALSRMQVSSQLSKGFAKAMLG